MTGPARGSVSVSKFTHETGHDQSEITGHEIFEMTGHATETTGHDGLKYALEIVAIINTRYERLSVKDLMSHSEIGSPATIHQYIHAMVDKGWIRLTRSEEHTSELQSH